MVGDDDQNDLRMIDINGTSKICYRIASHNVQPRATTF